jgi:hypothetical protein
MISNATVHAQASDVPESASTKATHQTIDQDRYALERGMNEFGIWGGGSPKSPTLIGTTEDARLAIVGLRYGRILAAGNGVAFEYTADFIPIAVTSYPHLIFTVSGPGLNNFTVERSRKSVYGAGLSPIGFQAIFRRRKRVKPFTSISGGFLYFNDPVPDGLGTKFNFTFDFGGGVQLFTHSRRAVTIGYKFQHFSNAGRGQVNPGFDANIFYAGFSVFK